jgi:tRNA(fMet)-specific endonuclease VapC
VAQRVSFDTSFLIDFQRERLAGGAGPAHRFLAAHPAIQLCLPAVALGEFAEGFADAAHPLVRLVRDTHEILPVDAEVAVAYARATRELRARGALIGGNDLWIAATALRYELPLVTADLEHFQRVPGLAVQSYRV